MATVTGLFERYEDVNMALRELNEWGFHEGDISIAAPTNLDLNSLKGNYTKVPVEELEKNEGKSGLLITVVAEGDWIEKIDELFNRTGAVKRDTRRNIWERGTVEDYIDITDRQRDTRSGDENRHHS
jgi:hypothetical protein